MRHISRLPFLFVLILGGCRTPAGFTGDMESILREVSQETGLDNLSVGPLDPSIKMLRRVQVRGSHRDLGYLEGLAAQKAEWEIPLVPDKDREANEAVIAFYSEIYHFHLEKVRGTAEAFGVDWRDVDFRVMERGFYDRFGTEGYNAEQTVGAGFPEGAGSCSVIGLSLPPESGSIPMVGRNLDTFNVTGFLVFSEMEGVYRSLVLSGEAYYDYAVDGINEKGLFIGEMSITDPAYLAGNLSRSYPDHPSVYMLRMMRIVLDTCANVDEAIALFEKVPVWFTHDLWHFYLADASGNRCVIEYDRQGHLVVIRGTGDWLVATNTPLQEDPAILELCPRYKEARQTLSEDKIGGSDDLYRLMGNISVSRRNPWLEGWIPEGYLLRLRTVWTTVYDLKALSLELHHWEDDYGKRTFFLD
jgi:hypothetical protein